MFTYCTGCTGCDRTDPVYTHKTQPHTHTLTPRHSTCAYRYPGRVHSIIQFHKIGQNVHGTTGPGRNRCNATMFECDALPCNVVPIRHQQCERQKNSIEDKHHDTKTFRHSPIAPCNGRNNSNEHAHQYQDVPDQIAGPYCIARVVLSLCH